MSDGICVAALDDIPEGAGIAIGKSITGTADDIALLRDDDGSLWALGRSLRHHERVLIDPRVVADGAR